MGIFLLFFYMAFGQYNDLKPSLSFERLQAQIQKTQSTDVENFLSELKKEQPDLFARYLSAYRSRSLQKSTPMAPRIILFSENTDFAISFNGHEKFKGFYDLEVFRYNFETQKFEFYEISFRNNERPTLSEMNPKKCLECHQSPNRKNVDPRPNWEAYNTWPGFYGSIDDDVALFKNNIENDPQYDKKLDQILFSEVYKEEEWHLLFKNEIKPFHPRYSLLSDVLEVGNYANEDTLNGTFTDRVANLNFRRVVRLMTETPIFERVKWTIWGYAKCQEFFIPEDNTYLWLKENSKQLYPHMPQKIYAEYPQIYHSHEGVGGEGPVIIERPPLIFPIAKISDIIALLFEPFDIDTSDWSMDFKSDNARVAAFERFGTPRNPNQSFYEAAKHVLKNDSQLINASCKEIEQKSLQNINIKTVDGVLQLAQSTHKLNRSPELPLIARCSRCHSDGDKEGIPLIPFDDSIRLASFLHKKGYPRGTLLQEIKFRLSNYATSEEQMPPQGIPTTPQKKELLDYLDSLFNNQATP